MFLSAQSFANLQGKGLICTLTKEGYTTFKPRAIHFKYSKKYIRRIIIKENDSYKFDKVSGEYKTDKDFISLLTHQMKINRKTLEYISMDNAYGTLGNCEIFDNYEKLMKAYLKIRETYQEEYNKTLEGNKL